MREELLTIDLERMLITQYCSVTERSFTSLYDVCGQVTLNQRVKEARLLYYIVQVLHSVYFISTKGYQITALDNAKHVQVFMDSSVKLHDFS